MTLGNEGLERLVELARHHSDGAARALAAQLKREQAERARLELLVRYRMEYEEQFSRRSLDGMSTPHWCNFLAFTARLDAAIRSQRETVARQARESVAAREAWQRADSRLNSFNTLVGRRRRSAARAEGRREQRELDEIAGGLARRASAPS